MILAKKLAILLTISLLTWDTVSSIAVANGPYHHHHGTVARLYVPYAASSFSGYRIDASYYGGRAGYLGFGYYTPSYRPLSPLFSYPFPTYYRYSYYHYHPYSYYYTSYPYFYPLHYRLSYYSMPVRYRVPAIAYTPAMMYSPNNLSIQFDSLYSEPIYSYPASPELVHSYPACPESVFSDPVYSYPVDSFSAYSNAAYGVSPGIDAVVYADAEWRAPSQSPGPLTLQGSYSSSSSRTAPLELLASPVYTVRVNPMAVGVADTALPSLPLYESKIDWVVTAMELIDAMVDQGSAAEALQACQRLSDVKDELPSDFYIRATALEAVTSGDIDRVNHWIDKATAVGCRFTQNELPYVTLRQYLAGDTSVNVDAALDRLALAAMKQPASLNLRDTLNSHVSLNSHDTLNSHDRLNSPHDPKAIRAIAVLLQLDGQFTRGVRLLSN